MKRNVFLMIWGLTVWASAVSGQRHWTVADGLPTGEVRQIVELPGGQMLVNCEGVFCISNGRSFDVVSCDQNRASQLPRYTNRYGQVWEGDSILWLHDFYRIYRFDARRRMFADDVDSRLSARLRETLLSDASDTPRPSEAQHRLMDSLHIHDATLVTADRQGGLWMGTRSSGIIYFPPYRAKAEIHTGDDPLIAFARGACMRSGRTMFAIPLADGRQLRCDSLCLLSYYLPEEQRSVSLNDKLPALSQYRYMVGACPLEDPWVAVYTQNGIFLLDTKTDTLLPFPQSGEIERYSSKYNCMLKDRGGQLWIGTQNGLFQVKSEESGDKCERVSGLANSCIRSLVLDADGNVWAGTSCGVSRITPTVVNLGTDDGIPSVAMMDRAAGLTDDGRLVFAAGGGLAVSFRPDEMIGEEEPLPVVITGMMLNGEPVSSIDVDLSYSQNNLTVQFSTLNYAIPSHDRYRYRLRGLESDWNICGDGSGQGSVSYRALPPGCYVFEVQASAASGVWGAAAEQAFVIRPPWWLTWWMKTACCLLALLFVVCLMGFYLKKKKAKLERENDARVNRLFELRDQARHHFAESSNIAPDKITVNAEEEKLVSQMLKAVEAHLDDEDYNADQLARDVAMSRASLYKKLQTMLGITPTDFIRNVRLKRAARLLADTQLPIGDIAARVGFVTARNFSSSFKKMFGFTPSDYRELF